MMNYTIKIVSVSILILMLVNVEYGYATSNVQVIAKKLYIDNKATFGIMSHPMCTTPNSPPLSDFTGAFDTMPDAWLNYPKTVAQLTNLRPQYESAKIYWFAALNDDTGYSLPQSLRDSDYFMGYSQYDEPDVHNIPVSEMLDRYNSIKAIDPEHIVMSTHYKAWDYRNTADITSDDNYPIQSDRPRKNSFFYWEVNRHNYGRSSHKVSEFPGPHYAWLQANGEDTGPISQTNPAVFLTPTAAEIRLLAYGAIVQGYDGISWWWFSCHMWYANGVNFGYENPTVRNAVISVSKEIKSLNDDLVSDTVAQSYYPFWDNTVKIEPNPTIEVDNIQHYSIGYILKSSGLLILTNKGYDSINDVTITVPGKNPITTSFAPLEVKIYYGGGTSPSDTSLPAQCLVFEKWKSVCIQIHQFCITNNLPASFCSEQKIQCEKKVDELIAKCKTLF